MTSKRAEELADKIISECMDMGAHWEPQSCKEIAPLMGRELAIHILQQALDAERDDALEGAISEIKKDVPKSTKVSENSHIYDAQDWAIDKCVKIIEKLKGTRK